MEMIERTKLIHLDYNATTGLARTTEASRD
jgi:hypothetical protein